MKAFALCVSLLAGVPAAAQTATVPTAEAQAARDAAQDAAVAALGARVSALEARAQAEAPAPGGGAPGPAQPPQQPARPSADLLRWAEDANHTYYSRALGLAWRSKGGDFRPEPIATFRVLDTEKPDTYRVPLARPANDLFIRRIEGGTSFSFHSLYATDPAPRPHLIVNGKRIEATRATYLQSGTDKSARRDVRLGTQQGALLAFDTYTPKAGDQVELVLTTAPGWQFGNQKIGVYEIDIRPADLPPAPAVTTTRQFLLDMRGSDILATKKNLPAGTRHELNGDALTVYVDEGRDGALGGLTPLEAFGADREVTTAFFTQVIRFDGSFQPLQGGKIPGLARPHWCEAKWPDCSPNGYGGWGGRPADGDSWTARTKFYERSDPALNPAAVRWQRLATYFYALKPSDINGVERLFARPAPRDKWIALTQMVKLNTVNADGSVLDDGEIAYWIDGECVYHERGVRWRTVAGTQSSHRGAWLDLYVGGVGYEKTKHEPHRFDIARVIVAEAMPDPALVAAYVATLK